MTLTDFYTLILKLSVPFNFLLLVFLLYKVLKKPVAEALSSRSLDWEEKVSSAESMRLEAEHMLQSYEAKIQLLDQEIDQIMQTAVEQGEKEKQKILARAEKSAERIISDAHAQMGAQSQKIKAKIKRELLDEAVNLAKQDLKKSMDNQQQGLWVNYFVEQMKEQSSGR